VNLPTKRIELKNCSPSRPLYKKDHSSNN